MCGTVSTLEVALIVSNLTQSSKKRVAYVRVSKETAKAGLNHLALERETM